MQTTNTLAFDTLTKEVRSLYPISNAALLFFTLLSVIILCILIYFRNRLGKVKTAYIIFFFGSLSMAFLYFMHNNFEILFDFMFALSCFGFAMSFLDGAYADYVKNSSSIEKEIQGISDFFVNIGYMIGPILSGILADKLGYIGSFSFLGGFCMLAVLVVLFLTPKKTVSQISS